MSANSDNPAGMSTRWLRQRVNELSASLADMTQTVWELSQTVSQLSENLDNTSTLAADNADRIHVLELSVWRYHERPGLMARLVAIGYDETEAAETVDMLVATGIDAADHGVALREQLATLRYTPTEIEECIEDVPGITQADIDYAKEILDAWDPATTSLARAYQDDQQIVLFPKLDTSNVTDVNRMLRNARNIAFVPLLDTSKVKNNAYAFGWDAGNKIKRLPDFDWSGVTNRDGPYTGLSSLEKLPGHPIDLSRQTEVWQYFTNSRIPDEFPGVIFNTEQPNMQVLRLFSGCKNIGNRLPVKDFPDNVGNIDSLYHLSDVSGDLSAETITARGVKNTAGMLGWNFNITHGPKIDMPQLENMKDFLVFGEDLVYVPDYSACAPKLVDGMLKPNNQTGKIRRVEGLNFARVTDGHLFGGDVRFPQYQLTYMRVINLGQSELASYPDFACALKWGTGSEEARQSLVNSLLTDSYDRAAAGMTPATVRLSAASKAALTAEEIAAITAKGFTIA
jgi:hypothetical protein